MHERIYVCHTFYHVYVTCLKEFHIRHLNPDAPGEVTLVLSKMSNHFDDMVERARQCGLFKEVIEFDEKEDTYFSELSPLRKNTGNIVSNMVNRIRFCKKFAKFEEPFVPVDFTLYKDIYVFCDSDPIGYYLNYKKIHYHALEDGLNCIRYGDTARFDNNGFFGIKAWMSSKGIIFIQNGYGRYCIDMEVNDISILDYPCPKYIEKKRSELTDELTQEDKDLMLQLFCSKELLEGINLKISDTTGKKVLILSEPLCDLKTREQIFKDLVTIYGVVEGQKATVMIKQHPRDYLDYKKLFPDVIILDGTFPMEMLNFIRNIHFDRLVSVYTVVDSIDFVDEKLFLGDDFMDRYEDPKIHRINEQIK